MFLKGVKMFQTIEVKGVKEGASYVQKVSYKLAGTSKAQRKTWRKVNGKVKALEEIMTRALSQDFVAMTSPEVAQELSRRLRPENLQYVIREYTKIHMAAMSQSDAWELGNTIGGIVGMFDLTGVVDVINVFAKPICTQVDDLDYQDQFGDWKPCTSSIDCLNNCCSDK